VHTTPVALFVGWGRGAGPTSPSPCQERDRCVSKTCQTQISTRECREQQDMIESGECNVDANGMVRYIEKVKCIHVRRRALFLYKIRYPHSLQRTASRACKCTSAPHSATINTHMHKQTHTYTNKNTHTHTHTFKYTHTNDAKSMTLRGENRTDARLMYASLPTST
jgi:hypothetical protein